MKRKIIACVLIVACVVAGLATMHQTQQVEAKSIKQHIPQVTINIRQNPKTLHNYFDPTFPCIRGRVANVTIKNTTMQGQLVSWWQSNGYKLIQYIVTLLPGKSTTSTMHAGNVGIEQPDYEIEVFLNQSPNGYSQDAIAFIAADGTAAKCFK